MAPLTLLDLPLEVIDTIIGQVLHLPTAKPPHLDDPSTPRWCAPAFKEKLDETLQFANIHNRIQFTIQIHSNNCAGLLRTNRLLRERTASYIRRTPPKSYELDVLYAAGDAIATWTWLPDWTARTKASIAITIRNHQQNLQIGVSESNQHVRNLWEDVARFRKISRKLMMSCEKFMQTRQLILHADAFGPSIELVRGTDAASTASMLVQTAYAIWATHWVVPRRRDEPPALRRITVCFLDGAEWEWYHPGGFYPHNHCICTYMSSKYTKGEKKLVFRGRA